MTSEEMTTGGLSTGHAARVLYARDSHAANLKNTTFLREFPDVAEENRKRIAAAELATPGLNTPGSKQMEGSAIKNLEHAQDQLQGTSANFTRIMAGVGVLVIVILLGRFYGES
jgi:hypothetical protein